MYLFVNSSASVVLISNKLALRPPRVGPYTQEKYSSWKLYQIRLYRCTSEVWEEKCTNSIVYDVVLMPLSVGMPYLQHLGLGGGLEGKWHVLLEQSPIHKAQTSIPPPIYPLQIPHISRPCHAQCVTRRCGIHKVLQRCLTQQKRMCMPFELNGTILTTYQPLGGRFQRQIPLLSPTCAPGMQGGAYHW